MTTKNVDQLWSELLEALCDADPSQAEKFLLVVEFPGEIAAQAAAAMLQRELRRWPLNCKVIPYSRVKRCASPSVKDRVVFCQSEEDGDI